MNTETVMALRVASESLAEQIAQGAGQIKLLEFFQGLMPSVINAFKGVDTSKIPKMPSLTSTESSFVALIDRHSYGEMREFKAHCPEGMAVTYLQYLDGMLHAVEHVLEFVPNILNPYLIFLAHLTSARNAVMSSEDRSAWHKELQAKREALEEAFRKSLANKNVRTETKLGNVIERNSDWAEVFQKCAVLRSKLDGVKIDNISKLVTQAEECLEIIYKNASNGHMQSASPEVLQRIADGAFQISAELEFVSVTYYRALVITQAVKDTTESITKVLGRR